MRHHKAFVLLVASVIALSLLPVQAASATATFTACTGAFIPLGVSDPGTWIYPGGNMHVRGMIALYRQDMPRSDYRCSGLNTVVTNANWDAYGVGPSWGTFRTVLEEGNSDGWEGRWTGMSYPDGTTSIHVVGHGFGDLKGSHVIVDIDFPGMYMPGTANGYILDPHGH